MQKQKVFLGIDIGSTNAKVCLVNEQGDTLVSRVTPHDGEVAQAVSSLLKDIRSSLSGKALKGVVTGTEGRKRITLPEVIAAAAVERGLSALGLKPKAVVSMGGEDLVVYPTANGKIQGTIAGNKCASGTGEFFRQQLGRMDMTLDDLSRLSGNEKVLSLSSRCSVFMKSDCTHRLNKGEASPNDIALSLCKVMADKVSDFFTKARIDNGDVLLIGGITKNKFVVNFLIESLPEINFLIPEQAPFFEAFGAALLADEIGARVPHGAALFTHSDADAYKRYPPLSNSNSQVTYASSRRGKYDPKAEYILGVDGGSTTTKAALINAETLEIVAEHYGRTHGDPVRALKLCAEKIKQQIGDSAKPTITLTSTTGSSRELLGVFLETEAVYNEIIAHAVGTSFFDNSIDTIFEIGGQDAKYVRLANGVPIDYAMNEACSAGTGSFIEESAKGDLNIGDVTLIGPSALKAKAPLKFGEHCSAFINSDIRKAIQLGASKEDTAAGIIFSITANYLNRVVGNRVVGKRIALQGGVAKNPAVPLAFAVETGRSITVPPDPELMGCFGVGLLAKKKFEEGLLEKSSFSLDDILTKNITTDSVFTCKACDNLCPIRRMEVSGRKYSFGGRCSKYTAARRKKTETKTVDYTEIRTEIINDFCPEQSSFVKATNLTVGIPKAFSFHSLLPFYSWYFHILGVPIVISDEISKKGIAKVESSYCFPAEIAHGAVQNILDKNVDFIFLPHFANMPTMEKDVPHGTLCPLTQGLPYFSKAAFKLSDDKILRPIVDFKHGFAESKKEFEKTAEKLGFSAEQGGYAYDRAIEKFHEFYSAYKKKGAEILEEVKANPNKPYVALFGRPYNAFTKDANMGIPRKFASQGVTVIPFDMIYSQDSEIFPNMYWYYGQQDMKAVNRVMEIQNLYLCWVSNFSCAPDSFMLHYIRWMLGKKPYLVLEIDSHTADAGLDTRVEAFLDVVESFRRAKIDAGQGPKKRRYQIERKKEFLDIIDTKTGERIDIRDPRVFTVFSSMGDLTTELIGAAANKSGLNAIFLPSPDYITAQVARASASGKECIPALLVLGGMLQFLEKHPPNRPNEFFVFFMPSTTGPCRTGQYYVYYDQLLEELGYENVIIITGESDNSYRELGPTFNRQAWWSLQVSDYFTDVRLGIELLARDREEGRKIFKEQWKNVVDGIKTGTSALEAAIEEAGIAFSSISRKRTLKDLRKVLIVGEIYVRRDSFSIKEIQDYLISQNIYPKVTDVTEWLRYTDHTRKTALDSAEKRKGFFKSLTSGVFKEKGIYHIEKTYKDIVEHKIARHIMPTGLVVKAPHDMNLIVENAKTYFIDPALESEATVSSGAAATGMLNGFDGVVIIAPFACLPGRLLEGVYSPWARERGFPVLTLENDAQPYPPGTIARIEIFAHNVHRFERNT